MPHKNGLSDELQHLNRCLFDLIPRHKAYKVSLGSAYMEETNIDLHQGRKKGKKRKLDKPVF